MAIYLEQRFYSREEIATLFSLDASNQNFSRQIKTKLNNLGYKEKETYSYSRKGVTISWTPQTKEEKITYLVRKLNIDTHVDPIGFAHFIERMCGDPQFQAAPWAWRAEQLHISPRTLQSWYKKLNDFDLFSKTRSSISVWKTFYDGNEKIQIPVHSADPSYTSYKEAWKEEFKSTNNDWNLTNVNMWKKFHCKYFSCCTIEVNGIAENEEIRELLNIVRNVL